MTDDLFDTTGRHWRVSSAMVTAATVTATVVTVTVSSCPSCLLLGKTGSNGCHDTRGFGRSGIIEGMASERCCSI